MMLIDNVIVDPPSDDDLRRWLEAHRERYVLPGRFDFVQIRVDGENARSSACIARADIGHFRP